MDQYEIVIDYTDPEKFKAGMYDLRRQLWHIKKQIKGLTFYQDRLIKMRDDAINAYCDVDDDTPVSIVKLPADIAKVKQ